jgi:hypothetical protein
MAHLSIIFHPFRISWVGARWRYNNTSHASRGSGKHAPAFIVLSFIHTVVRLVGYDAMSSTKESWKHMELGIWHFLRKSYKLFCQNTSPFNAFHRHPTTVSDDWVCRLASFFYSEFLIIIGATSGVPLSDWETSWTRYPWAMKDGSKNLKTKTPTKSKGALRIDDEKTTTNVLKWWT